MMEIELKCKTMILACLLATAIVLAGCGGPSIPPTPTQPATVQPDPSETPTREATTAPTQVEVVHAFEAGRGELPEGITIDSSGNTFVSVGYPFWFEVEESFGEIWQVGPDGEKTVLVSFPGGPGAAGLIVSPFGDLFYAYPNPMDPDTNGVYHLKIGSGEPERMSGSENIALANGLAITPRNMYISDSGLGAIWRIPRGGTAELWLQHEWLSGCDPETAPVGANGVAAWKDAVYVASTSRGLLVNIPVLEDGSAGEPSIIAGTNECDAEIDGLDSIDGIALDKDGNIFALLVIQNKLVRIDPLDGSHTVLATEEDGLYNPASIVFGVGSKRTSVLFTNYALLPPEPANSLGPGVLSFEVGEAGLLPCVGCVGP